MDSEQAPGDPWVAGDVGPRSNPGSSGARGSTTASPADTTSQLSQLEPGTFLARPAYFGALRQHHVTYLKKRAEQRKVMLVWTLALASAIVVVSTVALFVYMYSEWGHVAASVMVSWFGSVVVQVIGIVYLVAAYLFPRNDHAVEQLIATE